MLAHYYTLIIGMDAGDEEDKEDQKDSIQEVLPDFGEVEGQRVQLKGLDYTLLAEQAQDHKQGFTEQMRLKLDSLTHRLIGTQHHTIADSNQYLNKDND